MIYITKCSIYLRSTDIHGCSVWISVVTRRMSHLSAISSQILWITSASMDATASIVRACGSSKPAGRGGTKTFSLMYTHTENSGGVKLGDRGGQAVVPPRPIQATTVRLRQEVTLRWKCRGTHLVEK